MENCGFLGVQRKRSDFDYPVKITVKNQSGTVLANYR